MKAHSSFGTFTAMSSRKGKDFKEEFLSLMAEYEATAGTRGDEILLRFHVSDIAHQGCIIREILGERKTFISIVGQASANGSRVALEAWSLPDTEGEIITDDGEMDSLQVKRGVYTLLFASARHLSCSGSHAQMDEEWKRVSSLLEAQGASVECDLHRTWIYCRDVDNNYQGLVVGRNEWFASHGLTSDTHYISSTGIDGKMEDTTRIVGMDSFALWGAEREQVSYLNAPSFLSPTYIYGVAFERGTRICFGDGSLYFISGTASIDEYGDIVHPGDVSAQTRRILLNIDELMKSGDGTIQDLKTACVYLRDVADAPLVEEVLANSPMAHVPRIYLCAPVCRPGWLVEIDGIAANNCGNPAFPSFGKWDTSILL